MLIKATDGSYVNSEQALCYYISPKGDSYALQVEVGVGDCRRLATFGSRADAQKYLDKLMKALGEKVIDVDMSDWHYEGHKKTHKEIRGGGS